MKPIPAIGYNWKMDGLSLRLPNTPNICNKFSAVLRHVMGNKEWHQDNGRLAAKEPMDMRFKVVNGSCLHNDMHSFQREKYLTRF